MTSDTDSDWVSVTSLTVVSLWHWQLSLCQSVTVTDRVTAFKFHWLQSLLDWSFRAHPYLLLNIYLNQSIFRRSGREKNTPTHGRRHIGKSLTGGDVVIQLMHCYFIGIYCSDLPNIARILIFDFITTFPSETFVTTNIWHDTVPRFGSRFPWVLRKWQVPIEMKT